MTILTEEKVSGIHERSGHKFKINDHEAHGPDDMGKSVLVITKSKRCFVGEPTDELAMAQAVGVRIGQCIAHSVAHLLKEHDEQLMMMIFVSESWIHPPAQPEEVKDLEHGDLARDYLTNPDSKITQAVTTHVCIVDGVGGLEHGVAIEEFHYDDGGVLVWDELRTFVGEGMGAGDMADAFGWLFSKVGARAEQRP